MFSLLLSWVSFLLIHTHLITTLTHSLTTCQWHWFYLFHLCCSCWTISKITNPASFDTCLVHRVLHPLNSDLLGRPSHTERFLISKLNMSDHFPGAHRLPRLSAQVVESRGGEAGPSVVMQCEGSDVMLNKATLGVDIQHVFVSRGNESLASSSVAATGQFQVSWFDWFVPWLINGSTDVLKDWWIGNMFKLSLLDCSGPTDRGQ